MAELLIYQTFSKIPMGHATVGPLLKNKVIEENIKLPLVLSYWPLRNCVCGKPLNNKQSTIAQLRNDVMKRSQEGSG